MLLTITYYDVLTYYYVLLRTTTLIHDPNACYDSWPRTATTYYCHLPHSTWQVCVWGGRLCSVKPGIAVIPQGRSLGLCLCRLRCRFIRTFNGCCMVTQTQAKRQLSRRSPTFAFVVWKPAECVWPQWPSETTAMTVLMHTTTYHRVQLHATTPKETIRRGTTYDHLVAFTTPKYD